MPETPSARRPPRGTHRKCAALLAVLAVLAALAVLAGALGCGGSGSSTTSSSSETTAGTTAGPSPASTTSTSGKGSSTSKASTTTAPPTTEGKAPATAKVLIKGLAFTPAVVTIDVGDWVMWQNQDPAPVDVSSDTGLFKSRGIAKGGSFSFRFTKSGTYDYSSPAHPEMKGQVIVR
jgi:plastocyanin